MPLCCCSKQAGASCPNHVLLGDMCGWCCCFAAVPLLVTGLLLILSQLNQWLKSPAAAGQQQSTHPGPPTSLRKRVAVAATRLYLCLPRAAAVTGHSNSPVILMLLRDGLQLGMRLGQDFLWPFLIMVPRELRFIAWAAQLYGSPFTDTVDLCYQHMAQHKVCATG
jgi:hypothetical protein